MVPEISLTPQVLSAFRARFGETVAVFHSRLSMGERLDEWKRVKRGEAKIAVGTRSAVFAPFDNLGLIVMDEEQEHTYKSESAPVFTQGTLPVSAPQNPGRCCCFARRLPRSKALPRQRRANIPSSK